MAGISRAKPVRGSTVIMIAVAAVFGLLAVFVANSWLKHQAEERMRSLEAQQKPVVGDTIVVAARPLRFGVELSSSVLREIPWPAAAAPAGSFKKMEQVLTGGRRVVLTAIEPNEPVLASKITGPGQRATLSSMLDPGMKAVTVRVNDVEGVAGFVLPGDRVDVVVTRQIDKNVASSDVVLQNTKVLAIDQLADERTDKPSVVKAVTLETDMTNSQRLMLAAQVGTLSLALRKAGDADPSGTRLVTLADLHSPEFKGDGENWKFSTIGITRGAIRTIYSVPRDFADGPQAADVQREQARQ
jgi:pilus assembly protein CpaB